MTPPQPHHRLHIHTPQAQLNLNATFTAPWTVIFAPSGTGKSTLLRLMAGLIPSANATFDRAEANTWLPLHPLSPEHRAIAYAPQHASLFPHLSVKENVAFSAQVSGQPPAADTLHLLGISNLAPKRPQTLSGGQRQLVNLARALAVPHARLLLLDEPFTGVDRPTRDALISRLQAFTTARNLPVISVTHDTEEALLLQAEVVRLQEGRISAQGPAPEVLTNEITRIRTLLASASG